MWFVRICPSTTAATTLLEPGRWRETAGHVREEIRRATREAGADIIHISVGFVGQGGNICVGPLGVPTIQTDKGGHNRFSIHSLTQTEPSGYEKCP
jgi:hypothetical protein